MTLTIENFSLKSLTPGEFKAAYIKVKDLGDGGSASVTSYIEVATGREVAIKQIGESKTYPLLRKSVKGVVSEYECLCKLQVTSHQLASENPLRMLQITSHQLDGIPGIPKVYDLFVIETPRAYIFNIVMDMVKSRGRTVSIEQLLQAGKITPEFLDRLIPWLLRTVAAVHECEVVHRDMVGVNIIVDTNDQFFLIDFGEGYDLSPTARVRPPVELSEVYITYAQDPESRFGQYSVTKLKERDVYDVGILLFLLCKGLRWKIPTSSADSVTQFAASPVTKFDPIIAECLQWDPDARPNAARLRELSTTI